MCMKLTDRENALLTPLLALPPDWGAAENLLQREHFTSDEITRVAIKYADACDWDATNYAADHNIPHTYEFMINRGNKRQAQPLTAGLVVRTKRQE